MLGLEHVSLLYATYSNVLITILAKLAFIPLLCCADCSFVSFPYDSYVMLLFDPASTLSKIPGHVI